MSTESNYRVLHFSHDSNTIIGVFTKRDELMVLFSTLDARKATFECTCVHTKSHLLNPHSLY